MKIRILFAGDKVSILEPLKSMLLSVNNDWDIHYADSEETALQILEKCEFDMLISDMHMPENEGISILEKVKTKYPAILRIVISGVKDRDLMLKATQHAHQFLTMPDDAQSLRKKIEKIYSLQTYLHNSKITGVINSIKSLPGLPGLYLQIEEEINKINPSFKRIEELISKDMIMTVKILQLVNSAFFGLPVKIINPLQAINFLGLGTIKSLVLMVHLFSPDDPNHPLGRYINKLWDHSLKVAKFSKMMAVEETSEPKIVEETYIGGLLHDLGKIVFWQMDGYFADMERVQNEYHITSSEAEYVLYHTSHAEVGAYLMGIWGLPENLIEIVCFHHNPSLTNTKTLNSLAMVHLSDHILNAGPLDLKFVEELKLSDKLNYWREIFTKENNKLSFPENFENK